MMMKRDQSIYYLILSFLIICGSQSNGVTYGQYIVSEADSLNRKNFIEALYLGTDRDTYFSGEEVWFKLIKMERLTGIPVNLSKVVYLEILGGKDNIILRSKIHADGNFTSGVIRIPDTLSTGNYLIRAYTSWMKNYPDEFNFYRYISVINPFKGYERMFKKTLLKGSNIVNSSTARDVEYSQERYLNGMSATFEIIAEDPELPIAVRVINKGGRIRQGEAGRIIIRTAGLVSLIKEFRFGTDTLVKIPRVIIPWGVSEMIMTDEPGETLSRKWFCNIKPYINFSVDTESPEYQTRQKVKIGISAYDMGRSPLEASLSVSVIKKSLVYKNRIDLTSIDGLVRSGNIWFFSNEPSQVNKFLMTSANDSSYGSIRLPERPLFLPELEGEILSGVMKDRTTGDLMGNIDISLSFVGKNSVCQFGQTDTDGRFRFNVNITGVREIVIQPLNPENNSYYIELDQPFSNTYCNLLPPLFELDSSLAQELNNSVVAMQVNSIYEPFRQTTGESPSEMTTGDFYGKSDMRILLADYIELTTIKEVVKEIIPGLSVIRKNRQQVFKLINNPPFVPFENTALVLFDGVPIYEISNLLEVGSKEIERIDIFNKRYFYSAYVFDGIISFVSKRGDHSSFETENGIFRQAYEGFRKERSFYSPVYDAKELINSRIPDFRNTLFWEPELNTDHNGKAFTEFYTSDEKGEYIIIVEGITKDGRKGLATRSFVVR